MNIYLSTNYRYENPIREALENVQRNIRISYFFTDQVQNDEQLVTQVINRIRQCDLVIADITKENPNIFYEIGIAHTLDKPVLIVSQKENSNIFSLLTYKFYRYSDDERGIKNLGFFISELLHSTNAIEQLKPSYNTNRNIDYRNENIDNELGEILYLKGSTKHLALERWLQYLLSEIPGFEIQGNQSHRGKEYDIILWNSTELKELIGLGNPIPIEVKATKRIDNHFINSITLKASNQGFKSIILITTAELTNRNKEVIRNNKAHSGITILAIDLNQLREVHNSKDLLDEIRKSFREFFIY
jgi:hypothetical protein